MTAPHKYIDRSAHTGQPLPPGGPARLQHPRPGGLVPIDVGRGAAAAGAGIGIRHLRRRRQIAARERVPDLAEHWHTAHVQAGTECE